MESTDTEGEESDFFNNVSGYSGCSSDSESESSDNEVNEENTDNENDDSNHGTRAFLFEPKAKEKNTPEDEASVSDLSINPVPSIDRSATLAWCQCGHCQIMTKPRENICCKEIPEVLRETIGPEFKDGSIPCITEHPSFYAVCLDKFVLRNSWRDYKQYYGKKAYDGPQHKINRHCGYRNLVRMCWGQLGREIRVICPSCAVCCIRAHYPPPNPEDPASYVGHKFPE